MTAQPVHPAPQPTREYPDPQPVYRCFHCAGIGEVPVHYPDDRGGFVCNWQRCRHCNGSGQWTEPIADGIDAETGGAG